MPNPLIAVAGIGAGSSLIGAGAQAKAAGKAADAQTASAEAGIAEQRRQFDAVRELLAPYVEAGDDALSGQLTLLGMAGEEAQQAAISGIVNGPQFGAMIEQGENAILQNASATGGLRGGNTQGALAQFRPQVLSGLIDQQYSRLGGVAGLGQASAAGMAAAAQNTGNQVSGLLQQSGAAQAGGALAQGQAWSNGLGGISQAAGFLGGQIAPPTGAGIFSRWGF